MVQQQTATLERTVVLEPATQSFLDAVAAQGGKPLYTLAYADARKVLEEAQSGPVTKLPASVEERDLPISDSKSVSVRIYRPVGVSGPLPAVMYFHGGGWILGSKNTHDRLLRNFTNAVQAAFVFVNYTPAPESQFPAPVEEGYAVTKYIAEHGSELGLDGGRIAIAGDSAGGTIAAAVTLLAKQRQGPKLLYQVLLYPVTDADFGTDSYNEFAEGFWLTKRAMQWFWDAYVPNQADRKEITASPLRATAEDLKGLPPTLIVTGENDVLRDEGEAYARKLMQAGVDVSAVRYLATIHDFAMLNGLAGTPASISVIHLASAKLSEALLQ